VSAVIDGASRALTTAEIIAKKLKYKRKDIVVEDRLYSGAVHEQLKVIQKLDDKLDRVMLFGHNPKLTELKPGVGAIVMAATKQPDGSLTTPAIYVGRGGVQPPM